MLQAQAYVLGSKLVAESFRVDVLEKRARLLGSYENIPTGPVIDAARVIYDENTEGDGCKMRNLIAAY